VPPGPIPGTEAVDGHYEQAFQLLQSPATQRAFHLASEPDRVANGTVGIRSPRVAFCSPVGRGRGADDHGLLE